MALWRKPFQRNACKSITDERGRAGSGENDLCQKKIKPFAEHDLRVTLECAGNNNVFSSAGSYTIDWRGSLMKL